MRNSSLQGAYLIIAARALGLDCGPMSGFDNAGVDQAFFVGTSIQSNFICCLGTEKRAHRFRVARGCPSKRPHGGHEAALSRIALRCELNRWSALPYGDLRGVLKRPFANHGSSLRRLGTSIIGGSKIGRVNDAFYSCGDG